MALLSIFLTAIGLSMDAFAVSLTMGLNTKENNKRSTALKAGLYFGGFQALMPLIGWALGIKFTKYIESVDHWIAFILLSIIGVNMIRESIKGEEEEVDVHTAKKFIVLAIATSIDALAVGISFAFLNINIVNSVIIIGFTTFVLSITAVFLGKIAGKFLRDKAGIIGGVILIFIGLNILLEHLNII